MSDEQHYTPGTHENYNSFPSRDLMMEKGKELECSRRAGGGKGEPPVPPTDEGYLEIILGPMFSGKTTRIIQIYKEFAYIQKKVCVINYVGDKRYDSSLLSTHDKTMIPCVNAERLDSVTDEWIGCDVVIINEGQFFADIYETVLHMVDDLGKKVYICGLDGDFKRNKFGRLLDLIPHSNTVQKLNSLCALCKNGKKAIFSKRVSQEDDQVVIGSDNYIPLCRSCFQGTYGHQKSVGFPDPNPSLR